MNGTHRPRVLREGPGQRWAAHCPDCGWSTSFSASRVSRGTSKGHASWRIVRARAIGHYVERCGYAVFAQDSSGGGTDADLAELDY